MSEFKTASTEAMDEFEELEAATLTNWRPMVFVDGQWAGNALVFATKHEAEQNARALMYRWTLVKDSKAIETTEPVNYKWIEDRLVPVETKATFRPLK